VSARRAPAAPPSTTPLFPGIPSPPPAPFDLFICVPSFPLVHIQFTVDVLISKRTDPRMISFPSPSPRMLWDPVHPYICDCRRAMGTLLISRMARVSIRFFKPWICTNSYFPLSNNASQQSPITPAPSAYPHPGICMMGTCTCTAWYRYVHVHANPLQRFFLNHGAQTPACPSSRNHSPSIFPAYFCLRTTPAPEGPPVGGPVPNEALLCRRLGRGPSPNQSSNSQFTNRANCLKLFDYISKPSVSVFWVACHCATSNTQFC